MITVPLSNTCHNFVKQNWVSKFDKRRGAYDIYQCDCGLSGKRYGLSEELEIDGRCKKKAITCSSNPTTGKIRITKCHAVGKQFANLIDGSVHDVIGPPDGCKKDSKGVWVMGVGEPVKVLNHEFVRKD